MANRMFERITTPFGEAIYPKLTEPDTKFKTEGEYSTKLRISGEEAKALKDKLDQHLLDAVALLSKEAGKKLKTGVHHPIKEDEDNPGSYIVKASLNAKGKAKSGRTFDQRPGLFDAKGKPIKGGVNIGSGSTLKLSCDVVPYNNAATGGVGISLRLVGVQVKEVVEGYGSRSAKDFGFGEEDGFEAPEGDFGEEVLSGDKGATDGGGDF